jgi:hypothetical protein
MQYPEESFLTDHAGDPLDPRLPLARDTLLATGQLQMRAMGTSMLPAILPGDLLTFRHLAADDILPDQIVLVDRADAGWQVHRIVAINGDQVTTRGDALRHRDPVASRQRLLGVLVGQQRGDRWLPVDRSPNRRLPVATRFLLRHLPLAHRVACIAARRWPRLIESVA